MRKIDAFKNPTKLLLIQTLYAVGLRAVDILITIGCGTFDCAKAVFYRFELNLEYRCKNVLDIDAVLRTDLPQYACLIADRKFPGFKSGLPKTTATN